MGDNDERSDVPGGADVQAANVEAMGTWGTVIDDMAATAAEYEADGWETLQFHPGDVTLLTDGDRTGIDILVPDDEYEALETVVERGVDFDEYEVYRAADGDMVYLLVVMQDTDAELAVLFPIYYRTTEAMELFQQARQDGELKSYLRRLKGEYVELTHSDPELFEPPE